MFSFKMGIECSTLLFFLITYVKWYHQYLLWLFVTMGTARVSSLLCQHFPSVWKFIFSFQTLKKDILIVSRFWDCLASGGKHHRSPEECTELSSQGEFLLLQDLPILTCGTDSQLCHVLFVWVTKQRVIFSSN